MHHFKTFGELRNLYNETDTDQSGSLEMDEVSALLKKLDPTIESNVVSEIFNKSDTTTDGEINFKEFLTCLAIGFLLKVIPELEDIGDATSESESGETVFKDKKGVRRVFEMATEMYLAFDTDCTGKITFAQMSAVINGDDREIESAHKSKKHPRKRRGSKKRLEASTEAEQESTSEGDGPMAALLNRDRWAELDFDSDGFITYQEFIFTFVQWVSSIENDDEDED